MPYLPYLCQRRFSRVLFTIRYPLNRLAPLDGNKSLDNHDVVERINEIDKIKHNIYKTTLCSLLITNIRRARHVESDIFRIWMRSFYRACASSALMNVTLKPRTCGANCVQALRVRQITHYL